MQGEFSVFVDDRMPKFFNVSTDYILGLSKQKSRNINQEKMIDFINKMLSLIQSYLKDTEDNI